MLVQCIFGNKLCSTSDFTKFWNVNYGNCYTFTKTLPKIYSSGEGTGLSLILNVEMSENIGLLETGYGIRLTIHEAGSIPFPAENGITLSAGHETYIGLKVVEMMRMSQPYGDCIQNDAFMSTEGIQYSPDACNRNCLWNKIMEDCICNGIHFVDDMETIHQMSNVNISGRIPECSNRNRACVGKVLTQYYAGEVIDCNEQCGSKCRETLYEKTISSRQWPSGNFMIKLRKKLCTKDSKEDFCYTQNSNISAFNTTFLKVKIYFEDLTYKTITEEPMYQPVRFLSDIGGTLGLFIGASLLSGAEVLCLMVALIDHGVRRMLGKRADKVEPLDPQTKSSALQ